jgi:hypothetical protein
VADLGPNKKRIAQLLRMIGSSGGERRNAFAALERVMRSEGISWSDIGNAIELDDGKYTESELQEYGQALRAEGVEAGIKIGLTRASNGGDNGHFTLPEDSEMADYCRRHRDDLEPKHHSFVDRMPTRARSWRPLSLRERGYLASLYIQLGGRT